jgi:hypothetical protein
MRRKRAIRTKSRSQPVPVVNNRFAAALQRFAAAFLETSAVLSTDIKGTAREYELRDFLAERVPKRYSVVTGQVVDQFNTSGPQLDVLLYDQTRNFPFLDGASHILAAEALLASVEVKSRLDAGEVKKSCLAARKLRGLRPFRNTLGGRDIRDIKGNGKRARYFHCVFAYDTDLVKEDWLAHESKRFRLNHHRDEHVIDVVYVLGRGVLNLGADRGRPEDERGSAITTFYFSLLNFVERESARRPDTPYHEYNSLLSGPWVPLGS